MEFGIYQKNSEPVDERGRSSGVGSSVAENGDEKEREDGEDGERIIYGGMQPLRKKKSHLIIGFYWLFEARSISIEKTTKVVDKGYTPTTNESS